ncbi:MAG TPA: HupE/UreJ family protein [Gemmatimonadaceae bacterium]|nr:HupE/UreJ family protein [Gemmatimonadaceae bacterium]
MQSFTALGFQHIVSFGAADHILFIVALAAIYRGRDWRPLLWVISLFTAGHAIALGLAASGLLRVSGGMIEFLIPLTIALTGIENLIARERAAAGTHARYRTVMAGVFGVVHGAGFGSHVHAPFGDALAAPLAGFSLGVLVAQLCVLAIVATGFTLAARALNAARPTISPVATFNARLVAVSIGVTSIAAVWTVQRWPF